MSNDQTTATEEVLNLKKSLHELEETSKMLVRREFDLRAAYDELKALDQQKSEFVSIAAHQLRTPLTSVNFALQMLRETTTETLTDGQKDILAKAELSTKRMFRLIEDLLIIDALEYGKLALDDSVVNVTELIHEVCVHYRVALEAKKQTLREEYTAEPLSCRGDRQRLYDVFSNLIDNAIKYTPVGGNISVSLLTLSNTIIIRITDTGIGVPSDETDKIFRKFSRTSNAQRVDPDGSGLGLYICRKIIEQHKGSIAFEPISPAGTCFVVQLPYNLGNSNN